MASKYRNKKTVVDGITFDSQKEAARYNELKLMLAAGEIRDLKLQPQFTLLEGFKALSGERVSPMIYKADFSYTEDGQFVVEDVKGMLTDVYKIKRKMMLDRYGIKIKEI